MLLRSGGAKRSGWSEILLTATRDSKLRSAMIIRFLKGPRHVKKEEKTWLGFVINPNRFEENKWVAHLNPLEISSIFNSLSCLWTEATQSQDILTIYQRLHHLLTSQRYNKNG